VSALGVIVFILFLFFAIAFHEFGHFATAKWFKMKVDRYMIGFGRPIWMTKRGETEYGIASLPFGGYVRIAGMNPMEIVAPEDRDRVFKAKPGWQQAIVLVAGSFTHFLVAFIMVAMLFAFVSSKPTTTIEAVPATLPATQAVSPARAAGFQAGDRVLAIDSARVSSWDDARKLIRASAGKTLTFLVQRGSSTVTLAAHISTQGPEGASVGYLGVQSKLATYGPLSAVGQAGSYIGSAVWDSLRGLGQLFSPHTIARLGRLISGTAKRTPNDVTSIVGVGEAAGSLAGSGHFADVFFLIAGFNIFIGVVNLLPLPPLDGGHLAVLGYETVRRRRVDMRKLLPVSVAVVSVLVTLFVLSLYLDIVKPLPSLPG